MNSITRTTFRLFRDPSQFGRIVSARLSPRTFLPLLIQRRVFYHTEGIFGYRTPRVFELPDLTSEQLNNRVRNSNLLQLVTAYRDHGHKKANLDPLGMQQKQPCPELEASRYGLNDTNESFDLNGIMHLSESDTSKNSLQQAELKTIIDTLNEIYCGNIAYEFMHIPNSDERRWFEYAIESYQKKNFDHEKKQRFFQLLTKSEVFDHFMQRKFGQVKRYGLEGAESLIIALDHLFETSNKDGITEVVLCMAHRGRLNVLTDLLQFSPTTLFHKVKGNSEFSSDVSANGDVLSHLFNSPTLNYGSEKLLHVSTLPNPSHLEAVNPVALGKARAKQMHLFQEHSEKDCFLGDRVMCVQIHGDASFTGQGIVMEALGLSNLPHFTSGGSVHIILNNQLGYTTPATNARSTVYTSDVGKMVNAPVIHVNGDHPEDVAHAAALAFEYRMKFKKDVILDLLTFRRWGHNELDEPSFTQPIMYKHIRSRMSVPKLYEEKIKNEGILQQNDIERFRNTYFENLEEHLQAAESYEPLANTLKGNWKNMTLPKESGPIPSTGFNIETLKTVGIGSVSYPSDMVVHPRLEKYHILGRKEKINQGKGIDWATAEALAIGSLLVEGYNVRISGQDVGRGTFSQRHAMLVCQDTEKVHIPLNSLSNSQGHLEVANSSLSELAVLGFEYGLSIESPYTLSIWEAQFGDFFNSAQVIIDTYISSGETKWLKQSGLVMLLPHGFDGAGPEHSSCRIERFLQLSNDPFVYSDPSPVNPNIHVVNCTTPAQYFHVLRRQMSRNYRKPLIIATPKTLLRSPLAVSSLEDMKESTQFQPVLADHIVSSPENIKRVLFVSGKLYYDLNQQRMKLSLQNDISIIRIEELTPFPKHEIMNQLSKYPNAKEFYWCQEESQNGGAYSFVSPRLSQLLPQNTLLKYVGRRPSAAPATGIAKVHKQEHAEILQKAFVSF